jgi:hypothetical protein
MNPEVARPFYPMPRAFALDLPAEAPRDRRMAALGLGFAFGVSLLFWAGVMVMLTRVF